MGALTPIFQRGAVIVMDIILESGQGVKNLVQECWFFLCVGYHTETQTHAWRWDHAWTVSWINLTSLSLSLSLPSTSTSFSLSRILLPQIYLWWSWMKYLSQECSPSLYPKFSLPLQTHYQIIKWWSRKNSSVVIETSKSDIQLIFFSCQSFTLTYWARHLYCGLQCHIFDSEINTFSTMFTWGL